MIVEERFSDGVNIYVDGFVFTQFTQDAHWILGDGDNSDSRWQQCASSRNMPVTFFKQYYEGLSRAAAAQKDSEWSYRYHVVTLQGNASPALVELMNTIEAHIEQADIFQDRQACEDMLKQHASLGQIRMYGLAIRRYIQVKDKSSSPRIVYQINELTDNEKQILIAPELFDRVNHHVQPMKEDFMAKFFG